MKHRVLWGVVVLVAVLPFAARAEVRRPGEVAADVTVRKWAEDDAPSVAELGAGAQVVAHERRHGWVRITGAARGWIPVEAFTRVGSEDDQRQKLLAELAAASKEVAPQNATDRTDADLMYDAVRQWHGEPAGSATIDKVLAQSKKDADRNRSATREKVRSLFWKDPFADNPQKLVLVRQQDRQLLAAHAAKHERTRGAGGESARGAGGDSEVYHLRVELASVRAELASARAETNRVRAELARLESGRGEQGSSRGEAMATGEDSEAGPTTVVRHARRHARHLAERTSTVLADATPAAATDRRRGAARSVVAEVAPPPPVETVAATPPSGWRSSDPRGIIVVPMDTPVIVRADKKPHASR